MWVGIHRVHTIVGGWRLRISRILFWFRSEVVITRACHARSAVSITAGTARALTLGLIIVPSDRRNRLVVIPPNECGLLLHVMTVDDLQVWD